MRPPVILCPPRLTCFLLVPSSVCVRVCHCFCPLLALAVCDIDVCTSIAGHGCVISCMFPFPFLVCLCLSSGAPPPFPHPYRSISSPPPSLVHFSSRSSPHFLRFFSLVFLLVGTSPPLPLLLSRSARPTSTEELKHASARTHTPYMHRHVRIQLIIPIVITTIITKTI